MDFVLAPDFPLATAHRIRLTSRKHDHRAAIAAAAKKQHDLRETWLKDRSLTKLYNERPGWLAACHAKLAAAVAAAYGWAADLPDDVILANPTGPTRSLTLNAP